MSKLSTTLPAKAVLNVTVGESVAGSLARAGTASRRQPPAVACLPAPGFEAASADAGQAVRFGARER